MASLVSIPSPLAQYTPSAGQTLAYDEKKCPGCKAMIKFYSRPLAHSERCRDRIVEHVLADGSFDKRIEEATKKLIAAHDAELLTTRRKTILHHQIICVIVVWGHRFGVIFNILSSHQDQQPDISPGSEHLHI